MLQLKIGMDPEYITIFMFLTNYLAVATYKLRGLRGFVSVARLFQTLVISR